MRRRQRPNDLADEREARELTNAFIAPLLPPDPRNDETAPVSRATVEALVARVAKLEEQLLAQYSALASYATIAQQAVELARAEARSDLERSRTTILNLIDQLRRETHPADEAAAGVHSSSGRLAARVDELVAAVERISRDHGDLATSVAALVGQRMAEDGWLASSGDPRALSLR